MPSPTREDLQVLAIGDVTVLRIQVPMLWGDRASDELFERVHAVLTESGRHRFVLDLGAIQYFASAALGKLVALNRKAQEASARLVLCNVTPPVERILQVTHLADVLLAYSSESEAVRSLL